MSIRENAGIIARVLLRVEDHSLHQSVGALSQEQKSTLVCALQVLQNQVITPQHETALGDTTCLVQVSFLLEHPAGQKTLYSRLNPSSIDTVDLVNEMLQTKKLLQKNIIDRLSSEKTNYEFINLLLERMPDDQEIKAYIKFEPTLKNLCAGLQIAEIFNSAALDRQAIQGKLNSIITSIQVKIDELNYKLDPKKSLLNEPTPHVPIKEEKETKQPPALSSLQKLLHLQEGQTLVATKTKDSLELTVTTKEEALEHSSLVKEEQQLLLLQKEFYAEALRKVNDKKLASTESLTRIETLINKAQTVEANQRDKRFSENLKQLLSLLFLCREKKNSLSDLKTLLTNQMRPILEDYRKVCVVIEAQETPPNEPEPKLKTLKEEITMVISCWNDLEIALNETKDEAGRAALIATFATEKATLTLLQSKIASESANDARLFESYLILPDQYPLKESFWKKGLPSQLKEIKAKWEKKREVLNQASSLQPSTKTSYWPPINFGKSS